MRELLRVAKRRTGCLKLGQRFALRFFIGRGLDHLTKGFAPHERYDCEVPTMNHRGNTISLVKSIVCNCVDHALRLEDERVFMQ